MADLEKGAPLPKNLPACIDEYKRVQDIRLQMQRETDAVKARESELRDYIVDNLSKSEATGVAGKKFRAQIVVKEVPKAEDWGMVRAFIVAHDRFDLLQRRLNEKAIKDLWEEGVAVPGVGKFNQVDVSIRKL